MNITVYRYGRELTPFGLDKSRGSREGGLETSLHTARTTVDNSNLFTAAKAKGCFL